jgi:hypothetical protein
MPLLPRHIQITGGVRHPSEHYAVSGPNDSSDSILISNHSRRMHYCQFEECELTFTGAREAKKHELTVHQWTRPKHVLKKPKVGPLAGIVPIPKHKAAATFRGRPGRRSEHDYVANTLTPAVLESTAYPSRLEATAIHHHPQPYTSLLTAAVNQGHPHATASMSHSSLYQQHYARPANTAPAYPVTVGNQLKGGYHMPQDPSPYFDGSPVRYYSLEVKSHDANNTYLSDYHPFTRPQALGFGTAGTALVQESIHRQPIYLPNASHGAPIDSTPHATVANPYHIALAEATPEDFANFITMSEELGADTAAEEGAVASPVGEDPESPEEEEDLITPVGSQVRSHSPPFQWLDDMDLSQYATTTVADKEEIDPTDVFAFADWHGDAQQERAFEAFIELFPAL